MPRQGRGDPDPRCGGGRQGTSPSASLHKLSRKPIKRSLPCQNVHAGLGHTSPSWSRWLLITAGYRQEAQARELSDVSQAQVALSRAFPCRYNVLLNLLRPLECYCPRAKPGFILIAPIAGVACQLPCYYREITLHQTRQIKFEAAVWCHTAPFCKSIHAHTRSLNQYGGSPSPILAARSTVC